MENYERRAVQVVETVIIRSLGKVGEKFSLNYPLCVSFFVFFFFDRCSDNRVEACVYRKKKTFTN